MRKLPAALAVLALTAVGLVGCASTSDPASCPRPSDAGSSVMRQIEVTGSDSAVPDVDVRTPFHTETTQFEDVTAGDGDVAISRDDQLVVLDVALVSPTTGEVLVSTPYDGDMSRVFALSRWTQPFPAFSEALHCATAGTRVAVAIPPGGVDAATAQSLGLNAEDSLIAVLDVRKVYLPAADGSLVYNSGWGMPSVVRAPDGRPGVIVPDSKAPQNTTIQLLKRGSGPVVTGDHPVRLHYTVVNWTDKTVAETTWDGEPKSVQLSTQSKGFQEAVKGQAVGSQVMAIIPPADGTDGVKDTQIVVIDILGLDAATSAP